MTTVMGPTIAVPMPPFPVWRFTVEQYHKMIQAGILTEDDPVELLEGWIIPKMARNPPHDATIQLLLRAVLRVLPVGWDVRIQSAISTDDSEPEPDFAIVNGDGQTYFNRHPAPQDLVLVVEVSESTLDSDRVLKSRLYARAAIPVYWIVNLVDRRIEVYTDPTGPDSNPTYRQRQDFTAPDSIPLFIDRHEVGRIPVSDVIR